MAKAKKSKPIASPFRTPDKRYIIVRGRLWRAANPDLPEAKRKRLVAELMLARRAVGASKPNTPARRKARANVQKAKEGLGERGPVWCRDGAPDLNRRLVHNTPYAAWWRKRRARAVEKHKHG